MFRGWENPRVPFDCCAFGLSPSRVSFVDWLLSRLSLFRAHRSPDWFYCIRLVRMFVWFRFGVLCVLFCFVLLCLLFLLLCRICAPAGPGCLLCSFALCFVISTWYLSVWIFICGLCVIIQLKFAFTNTTICNCFTVGAMCGFSHRHANRHDTILYTQAWTLLLSYYIQIRQAPQPLPVICRSLDLVGVIDVFTPVGYILSSRSPALCTWSVRCDDDDDAILVPKGAWRWTEPRGERIYAPYCTSAMTSAMNDCLLLYT